MRHDVVHGPSFAVLKVALDPNETITAESGTMVSRSSSVHMHTRLNAPTDEGLWGRIKVFFIAVLRKVMAGDTLFINDFSTAGGTGQLTLAPAMSGHILSRKLHGDTLLMWRGAFLACTPGVKLRMRWGGLRGLLSSEGLFLMEASGTGEVFFTSYGGVHEVQVEREFIVDTGHVVAFDGTLDFNLASAGGGVTGFLASGEGLVCRFTGTGRVYIQSRNLSALASWLGSYLP